MRLATMQSRRTGKKKETKITLTTTVENCLGCITKNKVKETLYRSWGFQKVQASRLHDNWRMKVVRLSALRTDRLYAPWSIRGWVVDPRATVQLKELSQWKIPKTPSGIEPARRADIPPCYFHEETVGLFRKLWIQQPPTSSVLPLRKSACTARKPNYFFFFLFVVKFKSRRFTFLTWLINSVACSAARTFDYLLICSGIVFVGLYHFRLRDATELSVRLSNRLGAFKQYALEPWTISSNASDTHSTSQLL